MLTVAASSPLVNDKVTKKARRQRPKSLKSTTTTTSTTSEGPNALDIALRDLNTYDNDDSERLEALEYLERILARWAAAAAGSNNPWQRPRVSLVSFGSYRLGVHRQSSDLDVLAVSPPCCTRHDFFTSLVDLLQQDPGVSELHPIPQAFTPVLKFRLHERFSIDMLFARVADATKLMDFQRKRINPLVLAETAALKTRIEYAIGDSDLQELDAAGVRSMNGARVSQILLERVPNVDNFRTVLRAVKEWAVQSGIYANVLGFWGGINLALLVAYVCIRHPQESSDKLLELFFSTFASWKWPKPVLLGAIQDVPPPGVLPLPAWNPNVNPRDGLHICPIVTPCYPSMNSSYNVGMPQLRRIQDELIIACNHLKQHPGDYAKLFSPSDFFTRHAHYLQVTIRAANRQDFVEWFRLVESRLRLLISDMETQQVHAWPWSKFYDVAYDPDGNCLGAGMTPDENAWHESLFYIAVRFAPGLQDMHLGPLASDFLHKVNMWDKRKPMMELSLDHVTQAELPSFVSGKRNVKTWSSLLLSPQVKKENQGDESSPDLSSPTKKCRIATSP